MQFELTDPIESYPTDVSSLLDDSGLYVLPINLYVDIQKYFTLKEWEVVYSILFDIWGDFCTTCEENDQEVNSIDYEWIINLAENLYTLRHLD